jgi:hypothetical protein
MPANQTDGPKDWCPKPDFVRGERLDWAPDPRIFEIYDVGQVALALQESSAELAVYEFTPNVDVEELALQSARDIIEKRRELHDFRRRQVVEIPEDQNIAEGRALTVVPDSQPMVKSTRMSA